MATQSTVNVYQAPGIAGDFYDDSANFTFPAIAVSGAVVGNAVTYASAGTDPQLVQAGGSGAFAGIVVNGKELLRANGLVAGLSVSSGTIVPVCDHGNIWVTVETAIEVGYIPTYNQATGAIGGYASGGSAATSHAVIPDASFIMTNAVSGGMAVLRLKN